MKTSESIIDLVKALSKAQGEFEVATFDKTNPHFKNKYATLESVYGAVKGALAKNDLAISHLVDTDKMETVLFHTSGQWMACTVNLPTNLAPQQFGATLTYFRRYTISCLLAISTGEDDADDDGETAQKAWEDQKKEKEPGLSNVQVLDIIDSIAGDDDLGKRILRGYGVTDFRDIPEKEYKKIMNNLKTRKNHALSS